MGSRLKQKKGKITKANGSRVQVPSVGPASTFLAYDEGDNCIAQEKGRRLAGLRG